MQDVIEEGCHRTGVIEQECQKSEGSERRGLREEGAVEGAHADSCS